MKTLVAIFKPDDMSVVAVCPSEIVPDPIHIPDFVVGRTAELFTDQDELLGYLQGRKAEPAQIFQKGLRLARLLALVRGEMVSLGLDCEDPHDSRILYDLRESLGEVFLRYDIPTLTCAYCGEAFPSCTEKKDKERASVCPECWESRLAR